MKVKWKKTGGVRMPYPEYHATIQDKTCTVRAWVQQWNNSKWHGDAYLSAPRNLGPIEEHECNNCGSDFEQVKNKTETKMIEIFNRYSSKIAKLALR